MLMSDLNKRPEMIDETTIKDHHRLTKDDECYYLCEYRKDLGFDNPGFQLIHNIKKKITQSGKPSYFYKERDIDQVANALAETIPDDSEGWVLIPAPSSKSLTDPEYDDRLVRLLEKTNQIRQHRLNKEPIVIWNCLHTPETRDSLHEGGLRDPSLLAQTMRCDTDGLPGRWVHMFIFDDLLTTGCTFQACRMALNRDAGIEVSDIKGLFIARRVPPPPEAIFDDEIF